MQANCDSTMRLSSQFTHPLPSLTCIGDGQDMSLVSSSTPCTLKDLVSTSLFLFLRPGHSKLVCH